MATKAKTNGGSAGVLEAPNGERERIFEAFRRWGYLEADLDPLGFLRPVAYPELQIDGEFAREARKLKPRDMHRLVIQRQEFGISRQSSLNRP